MDCNFFQDSVKYPYATNTLNQSAKNMERMDTTWTTYFPSIRKAPTFSVHA